MLKKIINLFFKTKKKTILYSSTHSVYDNSSVDDKIEEEDIASDLFSFLLVDSCLDWSAYLEKKKLRHINFLDIGGEYGVHSLLFKSLFPSSSISSLDIRNFKHTDDIQEKIQKYLISNNKNLDKLLKNKYSNSYVDTLGLRKIDLNKVNKTFLKIIKNNISTLKHPKMLTESIFSHELKYDVIFSFSSVNYFHPIDFFSNLKRLLNNKGIAVIWMPSIIFCENTLSLGLNNYYSIASKPISYLIEEQKKNGGDIDSVINNLTYFYRGLRCFDLQYMAKIIKNSDFNIISSKYLSILNEEDYSVNHYGKKKFYDKKIISNTLKSIQKNSGLNISKEELFSPYYFFLIEKK